MAATTLFDKIWDAHIVREEPDGTTLLYIDRHLVHEVTSPQAFEGLTAAGRSPRRPGAALAVPDHNVPTTDRGLGIADPISAKQIQTLEENCAAVRHYALRHERHSARRRPYHRPGAGIYAARHDDRLR